MGFLGAAQVDKYGNINTTVIGDYHKPKVRLPGAGGAPEIAGSAKEVLIILKQSHRTFVDKLAFITSVGFGEGGEHRKQLGLPGKGPVAIITDLCIMEPEVGTHEFVVTALHPGVTREQVVENTGWAIRFAEQVTTTEAPRAEELQRCARWRPAPPPPTVSQEVRNEPRRIHLRCRTNAHRPLRRCAGGRASRRPGSDSLRALLERNPGLDPAAVDEVFMGSANQAGEDNRNVARMAALLAGLPETVPGVTLNRLCASGMDAVGTAFRAIACGELELAIAGGVESMSRAPM